MKRAIIIDDEHLARKIVREYAKDTNIEIIGECSDGFEAIKLIQQENPDLLFLDIQMPKINGFELLELLPNPPQIIFSTAYDEYALKAFEVNAVDYLLKPYSKARFMEAIERIEERVSTSSIESLSNTSGKQLYEAQRIVIKDGSEIKILPTKEISHLEAYDDYVKIFHNGKYHLKKKTMKYFEDALKEESFVRVHRSYIINVGFLTKIESFEKNSYLAILTTGDRIPISRSAYPELKVALGI